MTDITTTPARPDQPADPTPVDARTGDATSGDATSGDGTPGRQCARCRLRFPIEAGTHPMELIGWWTCPPCTTALLPGRRTSTADHRADESTGRAS